MTWLQRLRIFLGLDTKADRDARHVEMLKRVQDAANEYDRRDTLEGDDTRREKRRRRRW